MHGPLGLFAVPLSPSAGKFPERLSTMTLAAESCHVVTFPSPLGWMAIAGRGELLCQLTLGHASEAAALKSLDREFRRHAGQQPRWIVALMQRLQAYAAGNRDDFRDVAIDLGAASPFRRTVLQCCRRIPYGRTVSYAELAARAGTPAAARAVGNCMAGNRIPLVIPCHRVVRSDGGLGNYSAAGGIQTKRRLLDMELSELS